MHHFIGVLIVILQLIIVEPSGAVTAVAYMGQSALSLPTTDLGLGERERDFLNV